MELSEEQVLNRESSEDNLALIFHKNSGKNFGGRHPGAVEKPPFLKSLIALVSEKDTIANTAKAFETHQSTISSYRDGKTSPNGKELGPLVEIKENRLEAVRSKALDIVGAALDQITVERLEGSKLKDIASIAKDMSIVHEKMSEETKVDEKKIQVIIMTPKTRREEDMEIIEIRTNDGTR